MACKHLQQESHNLNKHAKCTIINHLIDYPATYRKGTFLDSKIRYAIPVTLNLVNCKDNKQQLQYLSTYLSIYLSFYALILKCQSIIFSKIHFLKTSHPAISDP